MLRVRACACSVCCVLNRDFPIGRGRRGAEKYKFDGEAKNIICQSGDFPLHGGDSDVESGAVPASGNPGARQ